MEGRGSQWKSVQKRVVIGGNGYGSSWESMEFSKSLFSCGSRRKSVEAVDVDGDRWKLLKVLENVEVRGSLWKLVEVLEVGAHFMEALWKLLEVL